MKQIQLCNKLIQLDSEDVIPVLQQNWYLNKNKTGDYCEFITMIGCGNDRRTITLQRFLYGETKPGMVVAHKDGKYFNFQRSNLKEITEFENRRQRNDNKSGYANIFIRRRTKMITYQVYIFKDYIGTFRTLEEAIAARNAAYVVRGLSLPEHELQASSDLLALAERSSSSSSSPSPVHEQRQETNQAASESEPFLPPLV